MRGAPGKQLRESSGGIYETNRQFNFSGLARSCGLVCRYGKTTTGVAQAVGCITFTEDGTTNGSLAVKNAFVMDEEDPACFDAYKLSYFDVATAFVPSAGGYGGAGNSGGVGDALLRIVDAGNFEGLTLGPRNATDPPSPQWRRLCEHLCVQRCTGTAGMLLMPIDRQLVADLFRDK